MLKKSLAVLLAAAFVTMPAAASALPDYPFIHATGTSFVYAIPDLGEIDFDISAYDPAPETALATVEARSAELRALFVAQGVAPEDVEFRDVRREIRKQADPEQAPSYDIKCTVHVNVRDLSKWRAIMQPMLAMPNLDAFATTFGTTRREEVEAELMAGAVKDALRKADVMARGFGKRAGAVTAISSQELKNMARSIGLVPSDRYTTSKGRTRQDPADLLMVGSIRMSQTVDAVLRIK